MVRIFLPANVGYLGLSLKHASQLEWAENRGAWEINPFYTQNEEAPLLDYVMFPSGHVSLTVVTLLSF